MYACTFDASTQTGSEDAPSAADADPLAPDADPSLPDAQVITADASPPGSPDASPPGSPDASPPLSYQVIDTLIVPVDSSAVVSTVVLDSGETYRLRVSGTFIISTNSNLVGDAEYFDFSNIPSSLRDTVTGVDNGVAVDDSSVDSNRSPRWGSFSSDHVYEVDFLGKGQTISVNLHDGNFSNNTGTLTLEILRLQ